MPTLAAHAERAVTTTVVCFCALLVLSAVIDALGARRFGRPSVGERRATWLAILMLCGIVFVVAGGIDL